MTPLEKAIKNIEAAEVTNGYGEPMGIIPIDVVLAELQNLEVAVRLECDCEEISKNKNMSY